jgi:hypothetical protein
MKALPKFDESDFKIPSETMSAMSCFGVTRTLDAESSESDSESPRHPDAAGEQEQWAGSKQRRRTKRSSGGGSGMGLFQRMLTQQRSKTTNTAEECSEQTGAA